MVKGEGREGEVRLRVDKGRRMKSGQIFLSTLECLSVNCFSIKTESDRKKKKTGRRSENWLLNWNR